ncbi:MAG: ABC transporter ATP-binding protein/permease [Chitinophagales bacterium]|nr:ABC transporter ATP-binding protein/permease [Chitinophagales bacterium]
MASTEAVPTAPLKRLFSLIDLENQQIRYIYFYAILSGIISLSLPLGIQAIINLLFGGSISTSLVILIIVVVLGVIFNGALQIMQMRVNERIQQRIFTRYSMQFAYQLPRMKLEAIDDYYLPELVNRFFDTASLQKGISKLLLEFPAALLQMIFGMLLLSLYNPFFILLAVFLVGLMYLIFRLTGPRGLSTSLEESDYKYAVGYWLEEVARTLKTIKFMGMLDYPMRRTDDLVSGYLDAREKHFQVLVTQYRWFIFFKVSITASLLILGSFLFIQQEINLGQFIAAEIVILSIMSSVEKIIISLESIYDTLTSIEKIGKVLDKPMERTGGVNIDEVSKEWGIAIKMENFSFRYPDGSKDVLKNINLEIKSGEKVCIFGSEGSGKTTLLRIFSGAYTNYKGVLTFNDIPLGNYDLNHLRTHIGVNFSTFDLFSGTLKDNLTLGDDSIPLDLIIKTSKEFGLLDFIQNHPDGLNQNIDSTGKKLSRNIVSKILLVRALLTIPRLLLLEDCWQSLELDEQEKIVERLTSKEKNYTMVAVTNDPAFAARCDKIMLLDKGELIAFGTFEEVSKMDIYKKLFKHFSL